MKVTQDNLADAILSLRGSSVLAVDTETTGLSETDKAFAVIIANAFGVYYFDERVVPNVFEELRVLFATTPARLVFQNTKFDIRMLESVGIIPHSVSDWYDLTSMARLVRNDHMEYNLASQAKRYGMQKLDGPLKKYIKDNNLFEERTNFFGEVEKQPRYDWVPVDIMCEYALMDARITFALYQIYLKLLDDSELKLAHDEAILNKVCYRMERLGMRVDTDKVFEAMSFEGEMVEEKQLQYLELTNAEFVNSAKSLQKVLSFELPKTDKGNPSADAVVLEGLLTTAEGRDAEIIRLVLDIRTYEKRISTYYRNYLIMKDKDSIIHPTMWIAGTKTGRFSYSEPNLQNISKDDPDDPSPERYSVRECFVPREGRVFISLDYSQMEYRMAADYAGETKVIEAVMNGADFHQATADMVGINRKPAKTLNFAVLYGAGIDKIATMLKTTSQAANQLKTKYFLNLAKIERLIDGVIATGKARGFVFNWAGRKLYAAKEFCYALPNHLIQGGGADVVKEAMRRIYLDPVLGQLWLVLQVHDQLVFELLPEELVHIPRIKEIMESVYPAKNGMKLTVDVSISRLSLAEKHMRKYDDREFGYPSVSNVQEAETKVCS